MPTVLVEGESDRRALDVLLPPGCAEIVVMCGITNLRKHLAALGGDRVLLLHDVGESPYVARVLADSPVHVRAFVCDVDLEDELIRAVGTDGMLAVVDAQGERTAYERMAQQPAQRERTEHQRLHRWLGARSGHKILYAGLLTAACPAADLPRPLRELVAAVG